MLVLPGCSALNARTLAERLRDEVFAMHRGGLAARRLRLKACFGVASSGGRSPFVVLREAESALQRAHGQRDRDRFVAWRAEAETDPAAFLIPVLQDEALRW